VDIDKLIAGILVTVMVELINVIAGAIIANAKKNNKNNGGKNNG
jgi:hypothetical protein